MMQKCSTGSPQPLFFGQPLFAAKSRQKMEVFDVHSVYEAQIQCRNVNEEAADISTKYLSLSLQP